MYWNCTGLGRGFKAGILDRNKWCIEIYDGCHHIVFKQRLDRNKWCIEILPLPDKEAFPTYLDRNKWCIEINIQDEVDKNQGT